MNLTEQEIKAYEMEAEDYARYEDRPLVINKAKYFEYILKLGATQESKKSKQLIKALEEIKSYAARPANDDAEIFSIAVNAINSYNTKQIEP